MRRSLRAFTCYATLLAFSALVAAPRGARAQGAPTDDEPGLPPPPASAPVYPQAPPPGTAPAYPPPGYPPAGYYYPPAYQLPPPQPVKLEEQPRWGLFIAGTTVFGAMYLSTSIGGYVLGNYYAVIPVVGPLVYVTSSEYSDNRMTNTFLVFDALVQAAGVAMAIAGLVSKQKVPVRKFSLLPTAGPSGFGLAAVGMF